MDPQNLPAATQTDILVYQGDAGLKMSVKTDGETVWLTQEQMCQLFGRDRSVVSRHIQNAFEEHELDKTICLHFLQTNQRGRPEAALGGGEEERRRMAQSDSDRHLHRAEVGRLLPVGLVAD